MLFADWVGHKTRKQFRNALIIITDIGIQEEKYLNDFRYQIRIVEVSWCAHDDQEESQHV